MDRANLKAQAVSELMAALSTLNRLAQLKMADGNPPGDNCEVRCAIKNYICVTNPAQCKAACALVEDCDCGSEAETATG